jgi:spore coat polysaccharide biosynthesis protein SpsF
VVRGPEENVLERVSLAVKGEDAEYIGRITADNPFTDPELFMLQWDEMKSIKADYSYCKESPKGSAADIWTVESFESSVENASTYYELEHINAWAWDHLEYYKVLWFVPPPKYISPDLSLSIDTNDEFVCVSNYAMSFEDPLRSNINDLIKISMS